MATVLYVVTKRPHIYIYFPLHLDKHCTGRVSGQGHGNQCAQQIRIGFNGVGRWRSQIALNSFKQYIFQKFHAILPFVWRTWKKIVLLKYRKYVKTLPLNSITHIITKQKHTLFSFVVDKESSFVGCKRCKDRSRVIIRRSWHALAACAYFTNSHIIQTSITIHTSPEYKAAIYNTHNDYTPGF